MIGRQVSSSHRKRERAGESGRERESERARERESERARDAVWGALLQLLQMLPGAADNTHTDAHVQVSLY